MYLESSIETCVIALFVGLLVLAATYDVTSYRIPNRVNMAIAALYPAYVMATPGTVDWTSALIVAAVMFSFGAILFAFQAMGGGDVKLIASVSLWAGPAYIADFIVVMAITGAALAVVLMSPLRHGLALVFDKAGNETSRDAVTAQVLPYGLAIAAGGLIVGFRLMALSLAL